MTPRDEARAGGDEAGAAKGRWPCEEARWGVRLVTLADGPERGVRLLEMRSGGGIDLEVVVDRGFDLGRLALDGVTLSWHSPTGLRAPWLFDPFDDRGQGFHRGFSGLLVTCGHDHIRQPETDPDGTHYPLHGHGTFEPAHLLAYGCEDDVLVARGEVVQAVSLGSAIRRRRRVTVPLRGTTLRIEDTVENLGWSAVPIALLYHVNLGYPLAAEGAILSAPGSCPAWSDPPHEPFAPWREGSDHRGIALSAHHVPAEAEAWIAAPDVALRLAWDGSAMPCLQLLRLQGRGLNGIALEPCTTHHRTRREARSADALTFLAPGEARSFRLTMTLLRGRGWAPGHSSSLASEESPCA